MRERTLGVVGTLVWDSFVDPPEWTGPREAWGGIAYALSALVVALEPGWIVRPIVKVGRDLAEKARLFLGELGRIEVSGLVEVADPNNRVELRYVSEADRVETLSGGVPPWTWEELGPRVDGCDALYVNFISGHELGLRDARALRAGFPGPIWADLHSLFLGADGRGVRIPRPLPGAAEWLSCFDAVQMNEDELGLLEGGEEGVDPVEAGPSLVAVTRGALGAGATAVGAEPMRWREPGRAPRPARTVSLTGRRRAGDPTGCGDVWGATVFARLLAGDELEVAVAQGNRLGGLNVEHRGAGGLAGRFARELAAGGPGSGP